MKYFFNTVEMKPEASFQKFDGLTDSFLKKRGYFDTPEEAMAYGLTDLETRANEYEQEAKRLRDKVAAFKAQQMSTVHYRKNTVGWWLQRLPEPYKSQAFANCNDDYCDIANEEHTTAAGALFEAFRWRTTPFDYWLGVYNELKDGYIALLPEPAAP